MITVTMKLRAAEGQGDELVERLSRLRGKALESPGCARCEVARSAHDERRFLVLLGFDDEAAHAAHANSEGYTAVLPEVMERLAGLPEIEIYEAL